METHNNQRNKVFVIIKSVMFKNQLFFTHKLVHCLPLVFFLILYTFFSQIFIYFCLYWDLKCQIKLLGLKWFGEELGQLLTQKSLGFPRSDFLGTRLFVFSVEVLDTKKRIIMG